MVAASRRYEDGVRIDREGWFANATRSSQYGDDGATEVPDEPDAAGALTDEAYRERKQVLEGE